MTKPFKLGILIADEDEIKQVNYLMHAFDCTLISSGIGLVNVTRSIAALKYAGFDMLVNLGTCGSTSLPIGTICEPRYFYQSDMQIGDRYEFDPAQINKNTIQNINLVEPQEQICFTGSSFITKDSNFVKLGYSGIFDMEAYGFVAACQMYEMPYAVIKVVSDNLNLIEHRAHPVLSDNSEELIKLLSNIYVTGCHAVE